MLNTEQIYDFIIENELATQETLDHCGCVAGFNEDTLNRIIYATTGFHDVEQLYECCENEFYFNDEIREQLEK